MFMALEVRVNEKCRTAIKNSIKSSIQFFLYGVSFMFTDDFYIVYSFLVNVWTANILT
jgi:hypothetical protein